MVVGGAEPLAGTVQESGGRVGREAQEWCDAAGWKVFDFGVPEDELPAWWEGLKRRLDVFDPEWVRGRAWAGAGIWLLGEFALRGRGFPSVVCPPASGGGPDGSE